MCFESLNDCHLHSSSGSQSMQNPESRRTLVLMYRENQESPHRFTSHRESSVYILADFIWPQVHWITEIQSKCLAITTYNRLLCRIYGTNAVISPSSLSGKEMAFRASQRCVYSCKACRWFVCGTHWKVGRNERLERDRGWRCSHFSLQSIIHTGESLQYLVAIFTPPNQICRQLFGLGLNNSLHL